MPKLDLLKIFNLSANLLVASFQRQPNEDIDELYKNLRQGKRVPAGKLINEKNGNFIPLYLQLDRTNYRGKFNKRNFLKAVQILLEKFAQKADDDKELEKLEALTSPMSGEILINIPAGMRVDEEINILMASVLPCKESLVIRLLFVEGQGAHQ
ncbi:MAG: hypothetical protein CBC09_09420 [Cellvibrionales bacterium TMED49]|nr:hypothetical protein [Porticoccaceae bacterium]OUU35182.1 MAG: hypothetical protein CBC09_09420 [Cellvibrionales bacterium TMED49]|tara:strand:+ start:315 stop:776 length:462 start_codon:yes stop_codon:yes gene_type:complete